MICHKQKNILLPWIFHVFFGITKLEAFLKVVLYKYIILQAHKLWKALMQDYFNNTYHCCCFIILVVLQQYRTLMLTGISIILCKIQTCKFQHCLYIKIFNCMWFKDKESWFRSEYQPGIIGLQGKIVSPLKRAFSVVFFGLSVN